MRGREKARHTENNGKDTIAQSHLAIAARTQEIKRDTPLHASWDQSFMASSTIPAAAVILN